MGQTTLQRLGQTAKLAKGEFELIYYGDDDNSQEKIKKIIPEAQEIKLKPSTKKLSLIIEQELKQKQSSILIVSNWNKVKKREALIKNTNKEFESLKKDFSLPIIFLIPISIIQEFNDKASHMSTHARKINCDTDSKRQSSKIKRDTQIKFPSECIIQQSVNLQIRLGTKFTENIKQFQIVTIYAHITASGFKMKKRYQSIILPINEDSEEVIFELIPVDLGEQVVEIEFFYRGSRVGYFLVKTNVIEQLYE